MPDAVCPSDASQTQSQQSQAKTAWVIGGGRGIGAEISLRLAALGFEVKLTYTAHPEKAQATVAKVEEMGGCAHAVALELDAPGDDVLAQTQAWVAEHGTPDALVYNAGQNVDGLWMRTAPSTWSRLMRINTEGFAHVVRPLLRGMLKRRSGRIVAISSAAGLVGNAGQGAYSASKAGLVGAVRALAREVAKRQITVNAVAPGYIAGGMLSQEQGDAACAQIPMERLGSPKDVAAAVGFLVGSDAGYITGQVLSVNGGLIIGGS